MYLPFFEGALVSDVQDAQYLDITLPDEVRIDDLLAHMTLQEKIGQMALVEKNSIFDVSEIATYSLGGVLSGAGAKPEVNTAKGWRAMIFKYQEAANTSRLKIPLLYGVDAVHGHAHVPGATVYPHAIGLGAANDVELTKAIAHATAQELAATGVNWSYSPNLDLPRDIRWGRVYEAFSDDSERTANLGVAYIEGLQSHSIPKNGRIFVLGTLKHFVGQGSMRWGSSKNENYRIDQGVTKEDMYELRTTHLPAFSAAIEAGALSVMVGLNTWGSERTIVQKELLTGVLKNELNFQGFVVSDWYGAHEGRRNIFMATIEAANAGVDMFMLPYDYATFARQMTWANRLGLVSDERIDDAVRRILRAKFALGLFDVSFEVVPFSEIGSREHQALARQAVAQSLVLLKNEAATLPITSHDSRIYVAGSAANNTGKQAGAWTLEWQGVNGNVLLGATSILEGIIARAANTAVVSFSETGIFDATKKADVGIAVVGETPYAEGWGDREFPVLTDIDLETIKRLQAVSDKVIVVLVSGRPLLITNEIDSWDAVVAAWLPGSAGAGVADVLFGDIPFSGTLPVPWPSHSEQLPVHADGVTADATELLFSRGFGL